MHVKVYMRSPSDVLAPGMSADVRASLPDLDLPDHATVTTLFEVLGVGRIRPVVFINRQRGKDDALLNEGDRIDLVVPSCGG